MMVDIDLAWKIAKKAHKDQERRGGDPYINHIIHVEKTISDIGGSEHMRALGILHDVLEDSDDDSIKAAIQNVDFYSWLLTEVEHLTHQKSESYDAYIDRILVTENKDVVIVKMLDILDNLTDDPTDRQRAKYHKALVKIIRKIYNEKWVEYD